MKCAARGSQQFAKNSPSVHHRTNLSGSIFATKARIDNRKKCQTAMPPPHVLTIWYGELRPTRGWDLLASLGHPNKFQRVSRPSSVTPRHSSSERQPNLALVTNLLPSRTSVKESRKRVSIWRSYNSYQREKSGIVSRWPLGRGFWAIL